MAVREEERQQHDAADLSQLKLPWRDALGHLPAVLIAGGLLLYGFLSLCYHRFYGSLGVDPNDVGLSYTGTLARSSGLVVAYLLAVLFLPMPRQWRPGASRNEQRVRRALLAFSVLILGAVTGAILFAAGQAARHVEAGEPVRPLQLHLPPPLPIDLLLLAIHAEPASVEPTGRPGDLPAVERLREQDLLYLGQSTGTVVLYNPTTQEAVYVPASLIVLHVSDCSDELTGPPC